MHVKYSIFLLVSIFSLSCAKNCSVNVIGHIDFNDGIGRVGHAIADVLHNTSAVTILSTNAPKFSTNTPYLSRLSKGTLDFDANVNLFANLLAIKRFKNIGRMINIAYSMIESTAIPKHWTTILNRYFDLVIVPDTNLISVYKNSGVKIPVYSLPIPLYLEEFLVEQPKTLPEGKFVFGCSAGFGFGKNQCYLVEAFHKAFKNNENVILRLHGRHSFGDELLKVKQFIYNNKITNIEILEKVLQEKEYVTFMKSLDAYVLLSKGEGFSITPREALALGIPCIISNIGAHKTICDTNFVKGVTFNIPVISPFYIAMFNDTCGYQFAGTINDAADAFLDVYKNYPSYKIKAFEGKNWVHRYLRNNVANDYTTFVNPKSVTLGSEDRIIDGHIETTSKKLYVKYSYLIKRVQSE